MTESQKKTLEKIKAAIFKHDSLDRPDEYEFKEWTVTDDPCGLVFVVSVVGRKGDEGTMAEIFARTKRHFSIGTRGGLTLMNPRRTKRSRVAWRRKHGWFEVVNGLTD